jgi:hypothetical protein
MAYGVPKKDPQSPTGYYIPENIWDALVEVDRIMGETGQQETLLHQEDDMCRYHHGFGTWMRNNWGLWAGSRLADEFNQLGITHPDDMTGIILTTYWRLMHGLILDVEGQVQKYLEYWKQTMSSDLPITVEKSDGVTIISGGPTE